MRISEILKESGLEVSEEARALKTAPDAQLERFSRLWGARDGALSRQELLLQARALILCALPYKRTKDIRITRTAKLGKDTHLSVTFGAIGKNAELPFGADRALFGWIQTKAYGDGFVEYDTLTEFFRAFGLDAGGRNYSRFKERLKRISHLQIGIEIISPDGEININTSPVEVAFTPATARAARSELAHEDTGQLLMWVPKRYGFKLNPVFWAHLRENPVPMPLSVMRLFHDKPKGWDFAQFVLYRCYAAKSKSTVPWSVFREQLGSQDSNLRRLRIDLKRFLREIKVVYPDLPAEFADGYEGLKVAPWRPPVD